MFTTLRPLSLPESEVTSLPFLLPPCESESPRAASGAGKLDVHMQKNEVGPLPHTTYKK